MLDDTLLKLKFQADVPFILRYKNFSRILSSLRERNGDEITREPCPGRDWSDSCGVCGIGRQYLHGQCVLLFVIVFFAYCDSRLLNYIMKL